VTGEPVAVEPEERPADQAASGSGLYTSEAAHPDDAAVAPVAVEPADAEPADAEPADAEPADAEPVGAEPAGAGLTDADAGTGTNADGTASTELLPGELADEPVLALFDTGSTERFRDRWQQLQLRFIDDPHAVAGQAASLVDEVVIALRDAVDRQRAALDDWQSSQDGDTERLRVAVRRYRDFLDRMLGL
jgi:hypothetical protein